MQRSNSKPPPIDFFSTPSARLPSPRAPLSTRRRNSLLTTTISTTFRNIAGIAALAGPQDGSASTVDSQNLLSTQLDLVTKGVRFPSLTTKQCTETVRPRTVRRHWRNRSDQASAAFPVLPQASELLLSKFPHLLDPGEFDDLRNFDTVFYLPDKRLRKGIKGGESEDKVDYFVIKGDHFAYRYEVLEFLGLGAFGKVIRCMDHKTGETVAVKAFRKGKKYERQANTEMRLFDVIQSNMAVRSKIVAFKDSFRFRGHVCFVYELLSLSLQECIRQNDYKGFSPGWIGRITHQLLDALVDLKSCQILHCDLKPDNIAFTRDDRTSVKVIDLGSGALEKETIYTYIQSRFYRSPEVILGLPYSFPIDMWSLGCVIAELYLGRPLFEGEDNHDQLLAIMEVLGPPPQEMIALSSERRKHFYEDGRPKILPSSYSKRIPGSLPLGKVLQTDDAEFLNFVMSNTYAECLDWQPENRLTPESGLMHAFPNTGPRAERRREKSAKRLTHATERSGRKNSHAPLTDI